jgi:hypothetical protein
MSIDKQYMKKLLEPLMNRTGIKINMYFSDLANNDIQVKDKKNIVDEKFIAHFSYLINKGLVISNNGYASLEIFGIEIGTNNDLISWNASDIMLSEHIDIYQELS